MADHESHDKIYMKVFGALCVFTLLSALADLFKQTSPGVVGVVVLAIAAAKAACVMLFFMHLKWERGWKYVLLVNRGDADLLVGADLEQLGLVETKEMEVVARLREAAEKAKEYHRDRRVGSRSSDTARQRRNYGRRVKAYRK